MEDTQAVEIVEIVETMEELPPEVTVEQPASEDIVVDDTVIDVEGSLDTEMMVFMTLTAVPAEELTPVADGGGAPSSDEPDAGPILLVDLVTPAAVVAPVLPVLSPETNLPQSVAIDFSIDLGLGDDTFYSGWQPWDTTPSPTVDAIFG